MFLYFLIFEGNSGRGSARLERLVRDQEVASSNLAAPTKMKQGGNDLYSLYYSKRINFSVLCGSR